MKNFDQHIQDALRGYDEDPDDAVWAGLKKELIAEKKKKRLVVFFVVLSCLVIGGTGIFTYLNYSHPSMALTEKPEKTMKPEIASHGTVEATIDRNKEVPTVISSLTKKQATNYNKQKAKSGKKLQNQPQEIKHVPTPEPPKQDDLPFSVEANEFLSLDHLPFHKMEKYSMALVPIERLNLPVKNATFRIQRPYFVGVTLMPALTHRFLKGHEDILAKRNANEKPGSGLMLGLMAGKRLNKQIDVSIGFNLLTYKQDVRQDWQETVIAWDSVMVRKRGNSAVFFHRYRDTSVQHRNQTFTNRFTTFQIPISVSYQHPLTTRTSFYSSFGLNLSYISSSTVNVNYDTMQGPIIEKTPRQTSYSRLGFGVNAGFGVLLHLGQHYDLSAGIHGQLSSNYFTKGDFKEYPYLTGMQFGIRKNF
jgi:hypothetical protein